MKEISKELNGRNAGICVSCGAIYDEVEDILDSCPNCNAENKGLYWVTPTHSWLAFARLVALEESREANR